MKILFEAIIVFFMVYLLLGYYASIQLAKEDSVLTRILLAIFSFTLFILLYV